MVNSFVPTVSDFDVDVGVDVDNESVGRQQHDADPKQARLGLLQFQMKTVDITVATRGELVDAYYEDRQRGCLSFATILARFGMQHAQNLMLIHTTYLRHLSSATVHPPNRERIIIGSGQSNLDS
jgi:hypothetical protein